MLSQGGVLMAGVNLLESQLFLDDTWVTESVCLGRMWHTAIKRHEPVLRGDEPWEQDSIVAYGTVLFHEGRFKLWYVSFALPRGAICYAESEDGVRWTKPRLGRVSRDGGSDNNILFDVDDGYVDNLGVIDDHEDTAWPLKMIYWKRIWKKKYGANCEGDEYGLYAARSKDGIAWDHTPGLILPWWGDRTNVMPARDNGKYVIYGKYGPFIENAGRRVVARSESEDLIKWSKPELVLQPDLEDGPNRNFYSTNVFRYESLYLGIVERMQCVPDVLDTELVFSHDGRVWDRSWPRQPFIPRGSGDAWDRAWVSPTSSAPICHDNNLLVYYSGRAHGHAYNRSTTFKAIGLASLRIDGFCSLYAQDRMGRFKTPPMRWRRAELHLNVDPRRNLTSFPRRCGGEVRVEVRDVSGKPIKGYTFEDCVPLVRNTAKPNVVAYSDRDDATECVRWKRSRKLATLAGQRISLAFKLRDAHIYAFKAVPVQRSASGRK